MHCGKIRGATLPDEYSLELFIQNVGNPLSSWNSIIPACEWESVCCDGDRYIESINWAFRDLSGTLQWNRLPSTLQALEIRQNQFYGEVDWANLPHRLRSLFLSGNKFSGKLNLEQLPSRLEQLDVWGNQFSGNVDVSSLPSNLTYLNISSNVDLEGNIISSTLPSTLRHIFWSRTKIVNSTN